MSGTPQPLDPNVLGSFAQAHGFTHGREICWVTAVTLVEKLEIIRRVDMGDRESFLGRHPQYGLVAIMLSTIAHCMVFGYEDFEGLARPQLSLV